MKKIAGVRGGTRAVRLMFGFAAIGLVLFGPLNEAYASQPPSVALTFTGNYVPDSCTVVGSTNLTVPMDSVSTTSLTAFGQTTGDQPFTIHLQCDSGVANARIYFESGASTDSATGNLIPQSVPGQTSASNVQIRLLNKDRTPISVGNRSTMQTVPVASTGTAPMQFIAQYFATGQTRPGVVQTYVTYTVEMP